MKIRHYILLSLFVVATTILLAQLPTKALAGVGTPNATSLTKLAISNTPPEVLNVSINDGADVTLTPNATTSVACKVVVVDYDSEADLSSVNATFYDSSLSFDTDTDDNNTHYTNSSCSLNLSYGTYNGYADDAYRALATCTFQVQYYANAGPWTCNASVFDGQGGSGRGSNQQNISELLALGLPDTMDFGVVNATSVSRENQTNVTNYGNTLINLSLSGYAVSQGDGNAMNCSQGSVGNISIEHEKYNLTNSNPGTQTLAQANANYTNLSSTATVRFFNLTWKQNDAGPDVSKPSYWRIYLPKGVAGNCTGNIVFGATTAPAA